MLHPHWFASGSGSIFVCSVDIRKGEHRCEWKLCLRTRYMLRVVWSYCSERSEEKWTHEEPWTRSKTASRLLAFWSQAVRQQFRPVWTSIARTLSRFLRSSASVHEAPVPDGSQPHPVRNRNQNTQSARRDLSGGKMAGRRRRGVPPPLVFRSVSTGRGDRSISRKPSFPPPLLLLPLGCLLCLAGRLSQWERRADRFASTYYYGLLIPRALTPKVALTRLHVLPRIDAEGGLYAACGVVLYSFCGLILNWNWTRPELDLH